MGCAPIAHLLWSTVMNYNPADPAWANRDRFVLSNGHALTFGFKPCLAPPVTAAYSRLRPQQGSLVASTARDFLL